MQYKNLVFGFGVGVLCGGIGSFIGTYSFKNKGLQKNIEIQENDERLHQVWDKAGHSAYKFTYIILIGMLIGVTIFNISAMSVIFALLIIMPSLHIGCTYYYNKKL